MSEVRTTHVFLLENGKTVTLEGSGIKTEQIRKIMKVLNDDGEHSEPKHESKFSWSDNACHEGLGHS